MPPRPLPYREVKRKLEVAGFTETGQRGSHVKFIRQTPHGLRTAIVPRHREVAAGTLRSILRQAGLSWDDFEEPLDEAERTLMDPDSWGWESAQEAIVEPSGSSVTEVRLSYEEVSRIEQAATAKGMTVNAYLRNAALRCAMQPA